MAVLNLQYTAILVAFFTLKAKDLALNYPLSPF